uniref:DNA polymerase III subunit chi n=1 Tax=Ningiella ruwaisensis TaxID=2364274 RepID=UPI00109F3B9D|nr:DNA polymerase III subunit chi [Ningiella ruwaisensis]
MRVSFYELPSQSQDSPEALVEHVSELILTHYKQGQYMTLLCETKAQAEALDEFIWQQPAEHFIAHNLSGEGPANGTPVDITWLEAIKTSPIRNKKLVINLSLSFLAQFAAFQHIIDFVPSVEIEKEAARERYKQYKQAGCDMVFNRADT